MIENELYAQLAAVTHVLCGVPIAVLPTTALAALSACTKGCRDAAANELKRRKKVIDKNEFVSADGTPCDPDLVRIAARRGCLDLRSLWTYVCESAKRGFAEGALLSVELRDYWRWRCFDTFGFDADDANIEAIVATLGTAEIAHAITARYKWRHTRRCDNGGGIITWEHCESGSTLWDNDYDSEIATRYASGLCRYGCVSELERIATMRTVNDDGPDASDWCAFWDTACYHGSSDVLDHVAGICAEDGRLRAEIPMSYLKFGSFQAYNELEAKYARPQDFPGVIRRLLDVYGEPRKLRDRAKTTSIEDPPEVAATIAQWIKEHPEQDHN